MDSIAGTPDFISASEVPLDLGALLSIFPMPSPSPCNPAALSARSLLCAGTSAFPVPRLGLFNHGNCLPSLRNMCELSDSRYLITFVYGRGVAELTPATTTIAVLLASFRIGRQARTPFQFADKRTNSCRGSPVSWICMANPNLAATRTDWEGGWPGGPRPGGIMKFQGPM